MPTFTRRRRRSRTAALAVVGAVIVSVLTACAPGPTQGEAVDSGGPIHIDYGALRGKSMTYLYFTDGPDEAATRAAVGRFEKATGANVNLQIVPFADIPTSLQARLAAGNPPEVARVADWQSLSDTTINFKRYFGDDYANQFTPETAKSVTDSGGHMLAVPSDLTVNGPFVNVDAFKKAGVAVPQKWTWDELVTAAKKVAQVNKMESAVAIDKSGNRLSTLLSQYGTNLIAPDGKLGLDTDKATKALTFFTGLVKDDVISKDFWLGSGSKYAGANDMFLAGQAAVYLSGPWQVGAFAKSAKFTWAAAPNPCAERCGGYPGGKYMVAFRKSKQPKLAAAFVEWMNRTDTQRTVDQTSFWLPTRRDLTASGVDYPSRNSDMHVFQQQVALTPSDTYPGSTAPAFTNSAKALIDEVDKVVAGQQDVAAAVKRIRQETQQQIATTAQ